MKRQIFLIDPLEKLTVKKDSTLLWAHTVKENGGEAYVLFEQDLHLSTIEEETLSVYSFDSTLGDSGYYLSSFSKVELKTITLGKDDTIHMRIDPPFNVRYLRCLWLLEGLRQKGVSIENDPRGILNNNEKLVTFKYKDQCIPSFVGTNSEQFVQFVKSLKSPQALILKPIDFYQGMGVEKVDLPLGSVQLKSVFERKVGSDGIIMAQPFLEQVFQGETRSLYYRGKEVGSILKVPPKGKYLANIAQGAAYEKYQLTKNQKILCDEIATDLLKEGISTIAFDLIGDMVSEVNITCPGLMVEISNAHNENVVSKFKI